MTLAMNNDGSEAMIFGLAEVVEATRLEATTVLTLYAKGLFPDPVHHHPPLWSANAVLAWVRAATNAASVETRTEIKRQGLTRGRKRGPR